MEQTARHNHLLVLLAALIALMLPSSLAALEVPPLKARVNDYAGMLSPSTVTQLEGSLKSFEADQTTQLAVLTIPSLEGEVLEEFSIKVADRWKIGQKGRDNGAILLIARDDRKLRIEVGYGLEGSLTDLVSGRIIREIITPGFKQGDFDQGVINGVTAMMAAVKGEFSADSATAQKGEGGLTISAFGLYMLFIVLFIISRKLGLHGRRSLRGGRRSANYIGGGGFGRSSGGFGGGFSGGGGGFGGGGSSGGW